ncbi:hypothetical protein [Sporolactobacillus shoreicorticis]|uniref:Uncharacterized protein n=1 Tax=Sporolactobacillus shoreicorticis TaxID=1923877 RepID=A0ABW5S1I5_9BACL
MNVFSTHEVDQALDAAEEKRAKMVLDVQDLDQGLTNEYQQINEDLPYITALYGELVNATRQVPIFSRCISMPKRIMTVRSITFRMR